MGDNSTALAAPYVPNAAEWDFWNPTVEAHVRSHGPDDLNLDYWLPAELRNHSAPAPPATEPQIDVDFWSAVPEENDPSDVAASDWGGSTSLPWFDPDLRENPYLVVTGPPSARSMGQRRARWLCQILYLPEAKRRANFIHFFEELFVQFPYQRTFQVLSDIALADIDPDSIRSGCNFRMTFLETPRWASRRSVRAGAPFAYHDPEAVLSWPRAVRLAQTCSGDDPGELIDDDWYSEWLELQVGHALYWSYLDYIEWRLRAARLGYMTVETVRQSSLHRLDYGTYRGLVRLYSRSRTGELARGQTDMVGVAYPTLQAPPSATRGPSGRNTSSRKLLG